MQIDQHIFKAYTVAIMADVHEYRGVSIITTYPLKVKGEPAERKALPGEGAVGGPGVQVELVPVLCLQKNP